MKTVYPSAKFGDWTVVAGPFVNYAIQKTEWLCRCVCGRERRVRSNNLKVGGSTNCGCRRVESLTKRNKLTTGGVWVDHASAAHAWDRMIRRCYDPKAKGFENYGGRGITVCERWRGESGLKNFLEDMGDPPEKRSLGRVENDGSYSKDNCRWETAIEQQSNTRRSVYGFFEGEKLTAAEIGRRVGKHSSFISKQIGKGFYANCRDLP